MSAVFYSRVAGAFFSIVALAHLYRIFSDFTIQIGSFVVPHQASWLGVFVAGTLGFLGLRARG
jgi:hypothetical protein